MIDRDIKSFLLRALLAAQGEPMQDGTLKDAVRNAFSHVARPAGDLNGYLRDCEVEKWIAGTNDELLGLVWSLTPKGKIRAQQLR